MSTLRGPRRRPGGRRRYILALAILVLGVVAVRQTPFSYLPRAQAPELRVDLVLPNAEDVEQLSEVYLVPIEAAIRSIGGVKEIVGNVRSNGANLRVRLEANTDVERKAARLESELSALRKGILPERASLSVIPGQLSFDLTLVVWLRDRAEGAGGAISVERFRSGLESLASVRNVAHVGEARQTLNIEPHASGSTVEQTERSIERALSNRSYGHLEDGSSTRLLVEEPWRGSLANLPVTPSSSPGSGFSEPSGALTSRAVLLSALSSLEWQAEEPERQARFEGNEGQAFFVFGEIEATPLEVRRDLDRYLERAQLDSSTDVVFDRSTTLREFLDRMTIALASATLLCFALGWLFGSLSAGVSWGLVLPLSVACSTNLLLLAGLGLDVTTLPVFLLSQAAGPMFYALRCGAQVGGSKTLTAAITIAVSAATLLVASRLLGGEIGQLLIRPALVLLLSVLAALLAASIPPVTTLRGQRAAAAAAGFGLRHGWAVALVAAVATYFAFAIGSKTLEPVVGSIDPPIADLVVEARFGEATSLSETATRLATIEEHLSRSVAVSSYWSEWQRGRGTVTVEVAKQARDRDQLNVLARQLEFQLASIPGAISVRSLRSSGGSGSAVDLSGSLGSRPETDEDAVAYRFILRSTRLEDLERARALIVARFAQQRIHPTELLTDWGKSQPILRLEPLPGASGADLELGMQALRHATSYPRATLFPGEDTLGYRVISETGPESEDSIPDRSILAQALPTGDGDRAAIHSVSPAHLFSATRVLVPPAVLREDGRFALPITLRMRWTQVRRVEARNWVHSALQTLPLPSSIELELPHYNRWAFTERRVEMIRAFGVLPLLLFLLCAIRTDSIETGLTSLAATGAAVAGAAIVLQSASSRATELTYLTLGSTLTLVLPMAIVTSLAALENRNSGRNLGSLFRFMSENLTALVLAAGVAVVLPFAAQLGARADIHPWALPLRAAALSMTAGLASALVVVPLLVVGRNQMRSYDRRRAAGHARPAVWTEMDRAPRLAVENLTKIYPGRGGKTDGRDPRQRPGGFRALDRLGFDLEAGIVGLLGPNGAGKTTLLRILCGVLEPTRGRVRFHGTTIEPINLAHYRHHVGFLPQGFNAYQNTTARAFLDYWALERGLLEETERKREIDRVLELVDLKSDALRNVRDFSGGMRRRIGIARALLGDPPILIVDEPTTGLDVDSRNRLRSSLLQVAEKRIVLFSTHIASDIAAAARRILVLDEGQMLFDGSARELIERGRGRVVEVLVSDDELRQVSLDYRVTTRVRTPAGIRLHLVLARDQASPPGATALEPSVEEAYLAIMASQDLPDQHGVGYAHLLDL